MTKSMVNVEAGGCFYSSAACFNHRSARIGTLALIDIQVKSVLIKMQL